MIQRKTYLKSILRNKIMFEKVHRIYNYKGFSEALLKNKKFSKVTKNYVKNTTETGDL